jgi:hypothetical protein
MEAVAGDLDRRDDRCGSVSEKLERLGHVGSVS